MRNLVKYFLIPAGLIAGLLFVDSQLAEARVRVRYRRAPVVVVPRHAHVHHVPPTYWAPRAYVAAPRVHVPGVHVHSPGVHVDVAPRPFVVPGYYGYGHYGYGRGSVVAPGVRIAW